MCRVAPARVARIERTIAWVEVDGRETSVACAGIDGLQPGDWVLCHAGIVVQRVQPEEATELLNVLAEIDEVQQVTT